VCQPFVSLIDDLMIVIFQTRRKRCVSDGAVDMPRPAGVSHSAHLPVDARRNRSVYGFYPPTEPYNQQRIALLKP